MRTKKYYAAILILSLIMSSIVWADVIELDNQNEIIQNEVKITNENVIAFEEVTEIESETLEITTENGVDETTMSSDETQINTEEETNQENTVEVSTEVIQDSETVEDSTDVIQDSETVEISTENIEINKVNVISKEKALYEYEDNIHPYAEEPDFKINGTGGEVKIYNTVKNNDNTFSCAVDLPNGSTHVAISVTDGKFVLPLANSELKNYGMEFLYGINTESDTLNEGHNPNLEYSILAFKITDVSLAENALKIIKYTKTDKVMELKISTTTVDLDDDSYIFYGHVYQVKTQSRSSWTQAVVDAHNTSFTDEDGATEYGYLATITSVNENKMMLNMISNGSGNYTHIWLGGTSNYQDIAWRKPMDYEYLNEKVNSGVSESSYFTDYTMKKSASSGHNELKGEDFYWIDGPEKGEVLPDGGDFWCDANHNKWNSNEPNDGHVVWGGYGGPYWDDIKVNQVNADTPVHYIVEFGGKIPSGDEETPISDAEAYRTVRIEEINVSFNDNKTVPNTTTETIYTGDTIELPEATRTGYKFLGWATSQNNTSYVGDADNKYMPDGDITLYAQWKPLIQFESVMDSGIYDVNNTNIDNANQGAISFNFRVVDFGKEDFTVSLLDIFDNFFIRVNDKLDIKSNVQTLPTYDNHDNKIFIEDNIGYWMHCIIENIPKSNYDTNVSAVPYAMTKDGEIIKGDVVHTNVNADNWVLKDW